MRFPPFGSNIKACLVFILGVLFITYVTARPVAGLEPDLLARSNQLVKVHISFPGGTNEFLQSAATRNVREAIRNTLEEYTPPGRRIEVVFPTPVHIPAFNNLHQIYFGITLDNGATGMGVLRALGKEPNYEDGPFDAESGQSKKGVRFPLTPYCSENLMNRNQLSANSICIVHALFKNSAELEQ
ncbi:hypothetical protein F5877DRAFT_64453 [Lentinula edodes]|nr:hypothetical protein F5877DRAFT_64453 [Lentinula edodes]